jgi:hypothetical protein
MLLVERQRGRPDKPAMTQKEPRPRAPTALLSKAADVRLLALAQDAMVLQLFPYGWQLPDGSVMREATNASYWRWINRDAQNAFLRKCARRR